MRPPRNAAPLSAGNDRELRSLPFGREIQGLEVVGEGLEFLVLRGWSARFGLVAIRVPRRRWFRNDNDPLVDARELLRQEAALLEYARDHGLAAPAVLALRRRQKHDFLITELVETDGSLPSGAEMGRVAARLHGLPPPEVVPVADTKRFLAATLAERLSRRVRVVRERTGRAIRLPSQAKLQARLGWTRARRRLLHMDFRPANLLVREGTIRGIVDWSNALIGDPLLELARIAEFGHLDKGFLAGYGDADPFRRAPRAVGTLYRLDAAVMLAVVFLSEAPERCRAARQVDRVLELIDELPTHV